MSDFNIVENPIVEKENYKINNPKIIAKINNDLLNGNPFHYIGYMASDYTDKMDADRKNDNKFSTKCLMLDDLGDEKPNTPASHDYFSGLLEKRHLYIKRNPCSRTIITTNFHSQELIDIYGSRVYDRLCEHYTICKFKDHSFRKAGLEIIEG